MPNRNRVIYQSESLYVGPTPSTGTHYDTTITGNYITGLYRIQNCNYNFNVARTPVNQFGELAAIDRVILETPTVGLSFGYLQSSMWNEKALGFVTDGRLPALSGILNRGQDDKNYFLKIVPEGVDAVTDTTDNVDVAVVGFGNGFLSSYSAKAAVNSFPTCDVTIDALNVTFATGLSGQLPAIFPENGTRIGLPYYYRIPTALSSPGTGKLDISTLRPGDITLDFKQRNAADEGILENATDAYSAAGVNISNAKIQSYDLNLNLNREPLQKLGSRFAFSKEIAFPVSVTLSVDAVVGDLTTGSLHDIINCDNSYDVVINQREPNTCGGSTQAVVRRYVMKNAKINSHSYSSDIGSAKTVSLEFESQIGGASQGTIGIWISGVTSATA